jgi:Icc-related predicted phosphoesterase
LHAVYFDQEKVIFILKSIRKWNGKQMTVQRGGTSFGVVGGSNGSSFATYNDTGDEARFFEDVLKK